MNVTIAAAATGFAAATSALTVTDVDLPQLVVNQIEPPSSSVATDNPFSVSFTITNQGQAAADGTWQQQVYLSDNAQGTDATLVGTYSLTATLNPGESFSRTVPVTAPDTPGDYWLVVADDVDNQIPQAEGGDNVLVSDQPVEVTAEYTAAVNTSISIAPSGTSVPFSGTATIVSTGAPAEFKLVDVHVDIDGIDRVVSALTDGAGDFNVAFTPLPDEAGVYTFFAAHPGVTTAPPQGDFSLVGLSANPSEPAVTVIPQSTAVSGQITLNNLGDVPLTDVTAVASSDPQGLPVTLTLGDGTAGQVLAGNGSLILDYTLSAGATATAGTSTVTVQISTNEGATLDIPIDVTVKALTPLLTTDPGTLYSGMVVGSQTLVSFAITNDGGAGLRSPDRRIAPERPVVGAIQPRHPSEPTARGYADDHAGAHARCIADPDGLFRHPGRGGHRGGRGHLRTIHVPGDFQRRGRPVDQRAGRVYVLRQRFAPRRWSLGDRH